MKQKKVIPILGIIAMILLVSSRLDAADTYTRPGWIACETPYDLDLAMRIFWADDDKALAEMVAGGRCFIFSDKVKVSVWAPEWAHRERQIRFPGSSKTYWVDFQALIYSEEKSQESKGSPISKHEWSILKSFLWTKAGKTTRQEIIQQYPHPRLRDESAGEYAYHGYQYPDFKEWEEIRFMFDGNVLDEIRVMKKKEE